jgi:hypothetical protein
MRVEGSTLGSLAPSVATLTASWRADSHADDEDDAIMRNKSPMNGMAPKGSPPPSGPSSLMGAS